MNCNEMIECQNVNSCWVVREDDGLRLIVLENHHLIGPRPVANFLGELRIKC